LKYFPIFIRLLYLFTCLGCDGRGRGEEPPSCWRQGGYQNPISIQEGLNAGMWTIAVPKTGNEVGLTREQVDALEPADLRVRFLQIEERFREAGAHYVATGVWKCPRIIENINERLAQCELP
jgi:hypothetical protein